MRHLTDHPEACPCHPTIDGTGGALLVIHRRTLGERVAHRLRRILLGPSA